MHLLESAFKVNIPKLMQTADASFINIANTATIRILRTTFWGRSMDGDFEITLLTSKGV
jgi:hypothetical protein